MLIAFLHFIYIYLVEVLHNAPSRELHGPTDQRRRFKVFADRAWIEGRRWGSRVAEGYIQDLQAAFALVTQPSVVSYPVVRSSCILFRVHNAHNINIKKVL